MQAKYHASAFAAPGIDLTEQQNAAARRRYSQVGIRCMAYLEQMHDSGEPIREHDTAKQKRPESVQFSLDAFNFRPRLRGWYINL